MVEDVLRETFLAVWRGAAPYRTTTIRDMAGYRLTPTDGERVDMDAGPVIQADGRLPGTGAGCAEYTERQGATEIATAPDATRHATE